MAFMTVGKKKSSATALWMGDSRVESLCFIRSRLALQEAELMGNNVLERGIFSISMVNLLNPM